MGTQSSEHPKEKGQQSEAAVLSAFVRHGVTVLEPFGDNERYDFVIEQSQEFYRVQAKTGRLEDGRVQFETRSTGTNTRTVEKEGYEDDIEVFAVYSPDIEQVFIVPIEEAPDTSMGLRIAQANKNSPKINWASEFTLQKWIRSIRGESKGQH